MPLPQGIRQNDFELMSNLLLFLHKRAAKHRRNAEHRQDVGRDVECPELGRSLYAGEVGRPVFGRSHAFE